MYEDAAERVVGWVRQDAGKHSRTDLVRLLRESYISEGAGDINIPGARAVVDSLIESGRIRESVYFSAFGMVDKRCYPV
jgi:hypothetical protein